MTFTAATCLEARRIARELRRLYPAAEGWVVEIVLPLFEGDSWRVNV